MRALSIRQPWAWLIVNGYKHIENRDWSSSYTGELLIHAAMGMTKDEYRSAKDFAAAQGVTIPPADQLERGGVVGKTRMTGCISESDSPWFFGKNGFVLENPEKLPFTPYKGKLGFFDIPESLMHGELTA